MTYRILTADRKEVKNRLEELTGRKAAYSGAPAFAYILDGITIGRDGTVTATEEADKDHLIQLVGEGLLEAAGTGETAPETEEAGEAGEVPDAEETATKTAQDAADAEPDTAEEELSSEENVEEAAEQPESEAEQEEATETETEDSSEEPEDGQQAGLAESVHPVISLPLTNHTITSLCNLIFSIYSKGDLLSKSSGGDFFVSEALKEKLKNGSFTTKDEVLAILKDAGTGDLRGLSFADGQVSFTGFPETDDAELIQAWTVLAAAITKAALKQSRMQARRNEETNEKFAFRTWLTRIGMNGPDFKKERALYYRNLTGHTAFRTPADEEKWKKRQAQRKAERLAAQAEGNTQETAEA